jgi:TatD DNase family protein
MTNSLLDTHCHLDAYRDPAAVVADAAHAGIDIVAVTEGPEGYRRLRTRLGNRPGIEVALGAHPLTAARVRPADLTRFFRLVPQTTWVGEIGLDFSRHGIATSKQQRELFESIIGDRHVAARPMTVHSRGAERETVSLLQQIHPAAAILHWYTGPLSVVDEALAAGMWFSVNPAMVRSAKGAALLARLPRDRVLLESDGPYARAGSRPAEPTDMRRLVRRLADLWHTDVEDIESTLTANRVALGKPREAPSGAAGEPTPW